MDQLQHRLARDPRLTDRTTGGMPDVASDAVDALHEGTLDLVGMSGIRLPVRLADGGSVPASCDAYVGLDDPGAKGIHMSRLYLILQDVIRERVLDLATIEYLLKEFLLSHAGLSSTSRVRFGFDLLLERESLISGHRAWRSYPVDLGGSLCDGELRFRLGVRVLYSSTCPCSSALSRQLVQERFTDRFGERESVDVEEVRRWLGREEASGATPHSQRSEADVTVIVHRPDTGPDLAELVDLIEGGLRTAVQAAVKREDEQEFARLNGENLMFCEDAARRLKQTCEEDARIRDYRIVTRHMESLHEHDAQAIVTRGVEDGLRA